MRFYGYIKVCQCCLLTHANGECCADESSHWLTPLSAIPANLDLVMGGEELGFSWQSCDGCGSSLGGDRYSMSLFYREDMPPEHVNYPHEPGRLYDCPACESQCFCTGEPSHTECVYCAIELEGATAWLANELD